MGADAEILGAVDPVSAASPFMILSEMAQVLRYYTKGHLKCTNERYREVL
jgi:hypothetical protein